MTNEAKLYVFLNGYDFLLDAFIDDVKYGNQALKYKYSKKMNRLRFIDDVVAIANVLGIKIEDIIVAMAGNPTSASLNPTIFKTWEDVNNRWKEYIK